MPHQLLLKILACREARAARSLDRFTFFHVATHAKGFVDVRSDAAISSLCAAVHKCGLLDRSSTSLHSRGQGVTHAPPFAFDRTSILPSTRISARSSPFRKRIRCPVGTGHRGHLWRAALAALSPLSTPMPDTYLHHPHMVCPNDSVIESGNEEASRSTAAADE